MTGSVLIRNLRGVVSGRIDDRPLEASSIRCDGGVIAGFDDDGPAETVVDAAGAVAIPGLIDTHAHVVFGDWTPRQSGLGWIEGSLHGGVTTMMSASEVHLPGRPRDPLGVKALAMAAQRAFAEYRPGGVKVHAGSLIVEPGLRPGDFAWLAENDVWLAKVGFGAFKRQADAAPLVRAAQAAGFIVMNHTGGASIPGSSSVDIDDVIALGCDIVGHANGGTTALPDTDLPRLFEARGALQLVQAGNLRSSLRILALARERGELNRILIATDTPTGTGIMPLGMLKTVVELSSLGDLLATDAIALATGNNAGVLGRAEGILELGRPADIALIQAPLGGAFEDPLSSICNGDLPGIAGVFVDGELCALRSRNTPAPAHEARVVAREPSVA